MQKKLLSAIKLGAALFTAVLCLNAQSTTSEAAFDAPYYNINTNGGEFKDDRYVLNGETIKNAFFCDGTYTYFLQADGTPMKDRLTYHPDGVKVIYFDANGHEVFDNFAHVKKSIAGKDVDDLCYFGTYGELYVNVLTYNKEGTAIYYANPYGVMPRGGVFEIDPNAKNYEALASGKLYGVANADGTVAGFYATLEEAQKSGLYWQLDSEKWRNSDGRTNIEIKHLYDDKQNYMGYEQYRSYLTYNSNKYDIYLSESAKIERYANGNRKSKKTIGYEMTWSTEIYTNYESEIIYADDVNNTVISSKEIYYRYPGTVERVKEETYEDGNIVTCKIMEYDEKGSVTSTQETTYKDSLVTYTEYDSDGVLRESKKETYGNGILIERNTERIGCYLTPTNERKYYKSYEEKEIYDNGLITSRDTKHCGIYYINGYQAISESVSQETWKYDGQKLMEHIELNPETNRILQKDVYRYDDQDRCIESKTYVGRYDSTGEILQLSEMEEWKYNTNGDMTEHCKYRISEDSTELILESKYVSEYVYNGNVVESCHYRWDSYTNQNFLTDKYIRKYENGKCLTIMWESCTLGVIKECEYDEAGNVKKVTSYQKNEKGEKESLRYTSYYEESLPKVISDVGQKYESVIEEMGSDNPESASYGVRSYTAKRVEWTSEEWYKKQADGNSLFVRISSDDIF